jgi:hypothetical protein
VKGLRSLVPALLLVSLAAHAYPIDLRVTSQGLDVDATPTLLGESTVVRLHNYEKFPVRCDVQFRNGPQIARTRKVTIEPGESGIARFMPSRMVVRLRVNVECWPAETDDESK